MTEQSEKLCAPSGKVAGSLGLSGLSGGSPSLRASAAINREEGSARRAQRAGRSSRVWMSGSGAIWPDWKVMTCSKEGTYYVVSR